MNIESIETPLAKCPECEGEGVVFANETFDASTNTGTRDDSMCPMCEGKGEVTLFALDQWSETNG